MKLAYIGPHFHEDTPCEWIAGRVCCTGPGSALRVTTKEALAYSLYEVWPDIAALPCTHSCSRSDKAFNVKGDDQYKSK